MKSPTPALEAVPQPDLLGLFEDYAAAEHSPLLYRRWAGLSLIAGALERRVWSKLGTRIAYPNLYIILVGVPGVGKGVINLVKALWEGTREPGTANPAFHLGRDSYTKASLVDDMEAAKKAYLPAKGPQFNYHSLLIAAEEFSVLFPKFEDEFVSMLTSFWNVDSSYKERRRASIVKEVIINYPVLNLLAGYQPALMASTFPQDAWDQGFARRTLMIYSGLPPRRSLFDEPEFHDEIKEALLSKLSVLAGLYGEMKWEKEAVMKFDAWHLAGGPPEPTHSRLKSYNNTRSHLVAKLAMVSSASRGPSMVVQTADLERAWAWLFDAERVMPDLFRAMVGDSDIVMMQEMYFYAWKKWIDGGKRPLMGEVFWEFLQDRCPANKIQQLITVMERAGNIERVAGTEDMWIPKAKKGVGVE